MSPQPAQAADALVRAKAKELGFEAVGVARADLPLDLDFGRYQDFVDSGMHGEMAWLAENAEARRRLDTSDILRDAKSVVCLARRYRRDDEEKDPATAKTIARYARGHDYHNVVRRKLRRLAAFMRRLGTEAEPARARPMIDDAPLLERAWAARAGLGFIGKNGLLIVPGEGSFVLLGEVVTTLELTPNAPMAERCGSCTLCLEACPTKAFVRPFVLDPRKCISYLTIEHRSSIEPELRDGVGEHLFGCDDCQTVCPFNASSRPRGPERTRTFEPLERWSTLALESLLSMDPEAWEQVSAGSPVKRATPEGLARNAAIVLGNRTNAEGSAVDALRAAAEHHPSADVRETAGWAVKKRVRGT
ncbi:MAG: tRNA epoxyqueuosine(34) reductase QueG [Polyangiaceae bacterium]